MRLPRLLTTTLVALALLAAACGGATQAAGDGAGGGSRPTLVIGGIPDQDFSVLEERFGGIADYLEGELGIPVEYQPSTSYAAVVTAFSNGDVLLGWFGGLTGVQARLQVDGAHAIAQRPRDREFHSVFIVHEGVQADSLKDLEGLTFTFGSESSTSGHLMPRYFLREAGIDPETDFEGKPGYSGSHDKTWKLVEAGSYQAGVLNAAVWQDALSTGEVDTSKVHAIYTTPPFFDYHWVAHPELNSRYGEGTVEAVARALLSMDEVDDPQVQKTLELFETEKFVETADENYERIAQIARQLGLVG